MPLACRHARCLRIVILACALSIPSVCAEKAVLLDAGQTAGELAQLRQAVQDQKREIEELRRTLVEQGKILADLRSPAAKVALPAAELQPAATVTPSASEMSASAGTADPAPRAQPSVRLDGIRGIEEAVRGLGGFRFSGDFIYVFDAQARAGNAIAPPLQNLRSRYRVRLNVDKQLNDRFQFHLQLSTGSFNNQVTVLQDFAGIAPKSPFNIAEAWIAFNPNRNLAFRVGRMEEAYMDGSRFLIDENIRMNGFEQLMRFPLNGTRGIFGGLFNNLEVRAGEYILTNPNVPAAAANSPYLSAGYPAGAHIGAANLFHPGITLRGHLSENWTHRLRVTGQIYRNANQIQLASTLAGSFIPGEATGVVTSTPLTAGGNATTTPGGAVFAAGAFRIAHFAYRMEAASLLRLAGKSVPAFVEVQATRNFGALKLRDAVMASLNLGEVRKFGDVRALYQFTIKDANSMVSQITDDDLGTGTGVNLAVHAIRVDVGLTRFLQWQNMFYVQNIKSPSNPAEHFYVPIERGANATFRYFGQLLFVF